MDIEAEDTNQSHLLSDRVKWNIVFHKQKGDSNTDTAKKVAQECQKRIWDKFLQTGNVSNNWSDIERPHALDDKQVQDLVDYSKENRIEYNQPRIYKTILDFLFVVKL